MCLMVDYLHGTTLLNVPQEEITIGIPAYSVSSDGTIGKILLLLFKRQCRDFESASTPRP